MNRRLPGPTQLRELFERYGVRPRKSLGQHFVTDPNTIRKTLRAARLTSSDRVVEIGSGAGSLTVALSGAASHVVALEVDARMIPLLREVAGGYSNVDIVHADALEFAFDTVDANKVLGNLPYNVATTIILRVLETAPQIDELTVMTQREAGERLCAAPGSRSYGLPTVLVQYFATSAIVAPVSRRAFYPVPNVDSVLVRIVRKPVALAIESDRLGMVVRAAFSQRRKALRNSLATLAGSPAAAEELVRAAGLDPGSRAEQIDVDGYVAMANALQRS
jgi:16S rRNA (adenine1518-N6/adenine1519-N6)-dimethyltransferase